MYKHMFVFATCASRGLSLRGVLCFSSLMSRFVFGRSCESDEVTDAQE